MIEKSDLPRPAAAGRGLGKIGQTRCGNGGRGHIASRLGETLWLVVRARSEPDDRIAPRWRPWRRCACSRARPPRPSRGWWPSTTCWPITGPPPGRWSALCLRLGRDLGCRPVADPPGGPAFRCWLCFVSSSASTSTSDASALSSGLAQLNKYLSRAWYRAGIPVQMHEDCTQAVYTTMLQQLGRDQFDALISDVGHSGIKDVFSRETNEGLDFFAPWT